MSEKNGIESESGIENVNLHGLIAVDKPPGPSSYDCIRFLKRTCRISGKWKIGHFGTLDPFASGLVIIALGQAVKYSEFALGCRKGYRARLYLGEETDTLDPTGKIVASKPIPSDWKNRLDDVAKKFTGSITQTPPSYSAKQVNGHRAYYAARKGVPLELKPVEVNIYRLEFIGATEHWVDFSCEVSSGTYIRALGRDIAVELGTVGHLAGLERTMVGLYTIDEGIPFSAFEFGGMDVLLHHLKPPDKVLSHIPSLVLNSDRMTKLNNSDSLDKNDFTEGFSDFEMPKTVRIVDSNGKFLALGKSDCESGKIKPFKQWLI
ncbi:MAG TPA: tRNA pseudouridine(55) synthase TruB [Firmicutes bacterium]|nr:tRNA pseudouridine(55) synthase TruB [Bacillota bacterium]